MIYGAISTILLRVDHNTGSWNWTHLGIEVEFDHFGLLRHPIWHLCLHHCPITAYFQSYCTRTSNQFYVDVSKWCTFVFTEVSTVWACIHVTKSLIAMLKLYSVPAFYERKRFTTAFLLSTWVLMVFIRIDIVSNAHFAFLWQCLRHCVLQPFAIEAFGCSLLSLYLTQSHLQSMWLVYEEPTSIDSTKCACLRAIYPVLEYQGTDNIWSVISYKHLRGLFTLHDDSGARVRRIHRSIDQFI